MEGGIEMPGSEGGSTGDPLEEGGAGQNSDPGQNGEMASNSSQQGSSAGTDGDNASGSTESGNNPTGSSAGSSNSGSNSGSSSSSGSTVGYAGSGDDPFADLANGRNGNMTSAERRAALDARLEESYAVFDGMILSEREQAQNDADAAGSDVMSAGGGGGGGGGGDSSSETFGDDSGSTVIASSAGGGIMPPGGTNREGEYANPAQETFPVPDDIPSGNNDDVVARQLREAAMSETDPELREALWDEYRSYTGISTTSK